MSTESKNDLTLPPNVRAKLAAYRRQVRTIKLIEAIGAAAFGLCLSYLLVFALDRVIETTTLQRVAILVIGSLGLAVWLPWMCHKWIWRSRRWEQVARILKTRHPRLGDYLLGVIELVNDRHIDGRSETLCRAALQQADRETATKDFSRDIPNPRHRRWILAAAVPLLVAAVALALVPAAGTNAFWRWVMPWRDIERYTFARIEPLPKRLVIPVAEPAAVAARLQHDSLWNPNVGSAWLGSQRIESQQQNGEFAFQLPPIKEPSELAVNIGDVRQQVTLDPQSRPELVDLSASVELPAYLQRTKPLHRDVRGGGLSVAEGSQVKLTAQASRDLVSATMDGEPLNIQGAVLETVPTSITATRTVSLEWRDALGLSAKTPLQLKIRAAADEAPTIICRDLDQQIVIMDQDLLSFQIDASDDYGVKTLGLEWKGTPSAGSEAEAAQGEKLIYAGNPEAEQISAVAATFSPQREKIAPQTLQLRIFAEDYRPDRPRVYSPVYTVFVLSEDEHAIWLTRRLDEWFKQSLETYELEQQLFKRNVELRNLSAEELDRPETRRKIESQAAAENAQSRRLNALTDRGDALTREAARNGQFGVDHLEKLAEMIHKLRDISDNRMPSVANLLKQAADAQAGSTTNSGQNSNPNSRPSASPADKSANNQNQTQSVTDDPGQRAGDELAGNNLEQTDQQSDDKQPPKAPSVTLKESSMDIPKKEEETEDANESPPNNSPGKLSLPSVTLNDPNKKSGGGACPAGDNMAAAVDDQEALLAEFQSIAEELQKLIGNLEGSTFVKRLKALSRRELVLANDIDGSTLTAFGEPQANVKDVTQKRIDVLAQRQRTHSSTMQHIIDDLDAYANRVADGKYKTVLEEMTETEIVKQVAMVADRMVINEPGMSIAQAELLADTMDRWAEQLVGPG